MIDAYQALHCEDADVVIVAYGITARAAQGAIKLARQQGLKVGLFRPITLWPFPEQAFLEATRQAAGVLVPEMNAGQLRLEIERLSRGRVVSLNRLDGEPIAPADILNKLQEIMS